MNVELVSVGTELLLGDIVNTNTAYLAKRLAAIGINIYKQTTVGDNPKRLYRVLELAFKESDTVIITGGLGPTDDDLTRDIAAEFMEMPLEFNQEVWQGMVNYLTKNNPNYVIAENNKKQAMVPNGATIVPNPIGTAPGLILTRNQQTIILMPGPPREMKRMYEYEIEPYLKGFSNQTIVSKYLRFFGIGESALEMKLKPLLDTQTNPTIALYAKTTEVLIRVTAAHSDISKADQLIDETIKQIEEIAGEFIYLIGNESIAETQSELHRVVANLLIENHLTLSVAESITGGEIVSSLIEQSGISQVLMEGIVAYSNDSKIKALDVKTDTLAKFGAVSSQVAKEMVEGIAKRLSTDTAIATTGIAGPTNDGTTKPIGLVYIATYFKGNIIVKEYNFYGDRELIRNRATKHAFNQLRKMILNKK